MTLATWNHQQTRVLIRLEGVFRVQLSPEAVQRLGERYATKHAAERQTITTTTEQKP